MESQQDGFEELVCQLAAMETSSDYLLFRRIGRPDGGKECYWELKDGSLDLWQAKYFTASPGPTQWAEIDKSVRNAIDNHPRMKQYVVCMPLNRPDGRVKGKKSMLETWNLKVREWEAYATGKGMTIRVEYWGSSELITRLTKPKSVGLLHYFFDREEWTDEWLNHKNKDSITQLGARYTSELNIDLPIGRIFDGLARDEDFKRQAHDCYETLMESYRNAIRSNAGDELKVGMQELERRVRALRDQFERVEWTGNDPLPLQDLLGSCKEVQDQISELQRNFYSLQATTVTGSQKGSITYSRSYSDVLNGVRSFGGELTRFAGFLSGTTCRLANRPCLLVTGEAGTGKSHLLADIVEKRHAKGQPSLLLLGEHFTNRDLPWTQILQNQLRKPSLDELEFLATLNAKAESLQTRLILFLDAINEGEGRFIWKGKLRTFIELIAGYPWLGVVVSIRSSFEELLAPEGGVPATVVTRMVHQGFAGIEHEAVSRFLRHYGIDEPGVPLLDPEFQNPLFLKLFCESLRKRGERHIPEGYGGFTRILESFLQGVEEKLSMPDQLDYDVKLKLVHKAVDAIIGNMADQNRDYVSYTDAETLVDQIFSGRCQRDQYLKRLISEGVLNLDIRWDSSGPAEVIYFAYQRFQDHLRAKLLLDRHLDLADPLASFAAGPLHELMSTASRARLNQNIIEALSIQVPERVHKELFAVALHATQYTAIAEGFVYSLIWRKADTVGLAAKQYINEVVGKDERLFYRFLENSIAACMKRTYYYPAEQLHLWLSGYSMSERDSFWTTWLHDKYGPESETNAVRTLVNWAWSSADKAHIGDEAIMDGCTVLTWLLTSCNRYMRDSATKALVNLLQDRVHLLPALLRKFTGVNDPYVLERLYAVAYGCTLRTSQQDALIPLSECVYQLIFTRDNTYPHMLLRDYARGVIEYTLHLGLKPAVDEGRIRPPYDSDPLPAKFPTNVEVDKKYRRKSGTAPRDPAANAVERIIRSMTTEYGRGTAGYGDFGRYTFESALGDWDVDVNGLSNYAVQRIFEMGYDPDRLGLFDDEQASGRGAGHLERIGKKYQWLAFFELLARVADHCRLKDGSAFKKGKYRPFEGPWDPYVRDIDPSILIGAIPAGRERGPVPYIYNQWDKDRREWIKRTDDLPTATQLLLLTDKDGRDWLWLEGRPSWEEPPPLGEDKHYSVREDLGFRFQSYLVKKRDLKKIVEAGRKQPLDLPETRTTHELFSREYYWSPGFEALATPYHNGERWTDLYPEAGGKQIGKVCRTVEYFLWEEEFDCSKTTNIAYYKPSQVLTEGMHLSFSAREGEMLSPAGVVVCKDPAVYGGYGQGLLVQRKVLEEFLDREGLALFWHIEGDKMVRGHWTKDDYPGRLDIRGLYVLSGSGITGNWQFNTF